MQQELAGKRQRFPCAGVQTWLLSHRRFPKVERGRLAPPCTSTHAALPCRRRLQKGGGWLGSSPDAETKPASDDSYFEERAEIVAR